MPSSTGQGSNYRESPWETTNVLIPLGYDALYALLPPPKPLLSEVKSQEINQVS